MALNNDEIRFKEYLTSVIKNYISEDVIIEILDYLSAYNYSIDTQKSNDSILYLINGIDRTATIECSCGYIQIQEKINNIDDKFSDLRIQIKINPTDSEDINVIYKSPDYFIKLNLDRGIYISGDDYFDFIVFRNKDNSIDIVFDNINFLTKKKIVKQP